MRTLPQKQRTLGMGANPAQGARVLHTWKRILTIHPAFPHPPSGLPLSLLFPRIEVPHWETYFWPHDCFCFVFSFFCYLSLFFLFLFVVFRFFGIAQPTASNIYTFLKRGRTTNPATHKRLNRRFPLYPYQRMGSGGHEHLGRAFRPLPASSERRLRRSSARRLCSRDILWLSLLRVFVSSTKTGRIPTPELLWSNACHVLSKTYS